MSHEEEQKKLCAKHGASWVPSPRHLKVGVARNTKSETVPINGLRHPPQGDTTGWYLWAGEDFSSDPDFFVPLHVEHLDEWRPGLSRYLGLPPGWRFLIDPEAGHEDVWEDPALLELEASNVAGRGSVCRRMMETHGFQNKAQDAFRFLCQDHGFSLRESTATRVVFESSRVCILVGFDAERSFELEVFMSLRNDIARAAPEPPYRLSEILGSLGVAKEDRFEAIQVTTEEGMDRLLGLMAQAVRRYGVDFIEGDVSAHRRVGRHRDEECRAYRRGQELARAREVAEAAWGKKDYRGVVQALSQVEDRLSKSDSKRLELARKRDSRPRRS